MTRSKPVSFCLLAASLGCHSAASETVAAEQPAKAGAGVKYEANWKSLDSRPTPKWFSQGKFGIFIHWGVYSVPAWGPKGTYSEWYLNALRNKRSKTRQFHNRVYGEDFKYEDFAPMFKCEMYDPDEWADIFARAGARYVVLTSKHHDGYCLWPSQHRKGWNSMDVGPKRDLLGDLTTAVRKRGLKMGFYYSLYEWTHPLYPSDLKRYVDEYMMPQFKDVVTRYKPSIIFSDGEWDHPHETWRSMELLAWLFNEAECRHDLVVNDRWGKGVRSVHGGYYTTEYGKHATRKMTTDHPWEECRGIGRSFGYNRNENIDDYITRTACIQLLIDMVSRGGNLLLDIGPTADGRIPVIMQDRLIAMGKWLKVNGEAIYGTTAGPYRRYPSWGRDTAKGNTLYLHVYDWPKTGRLTLSGLKNKVLKACLLADPKRRALPVTLDDKGRLVIDLTAQYPREHVTVLTLRLDGKPEVDERIYPRPDGSVLLHAATADTHGKNIRFEKEHIEKGNIGHWTDPKAWVSWEQVVLKPGKYDVALRYACEKGSEGSSFVIAAGDRKIEGKIAEQTGSWDAYKTVRLGQIQIDRQADYTITLKPTAKPGLAVMNLKSIELRPAK